jgi:hypothetical protein
MGIGSYPGAITVSQGSSIQTLGNFYIAWSTGRQKTWSKWLWYDDKLSFTTLNCLTSLLETHQKGLIATGLSNEGPSTIQVWSDTQVSRHGLIEVPETLIVLDCKTRVPINEPCRGQHVTMANNVSFAALHHFGEYCQSVFIDSA